MVQQEYLANLGLVFFLPPTIPLRVKLTLQMAPGEPEGEPGENQ
jgi:hypothetical protein